VIDALVNDPEKLSLVVALVAALIALVRGTVIPGVTHDRIVSAMQAQHAKELETLRASEDLWKQIAFRGVNLSESSVQLAAKRLSGVREIEP
jgi:hypothetical protein